MNSFIEKYLVLPDTINFNSKSATRDSRHNVYVNREKDDRSR